MAFLSFGLGSIWWYENQMIYSRMTVTLLVLWYLLHAYLAARRWTISILLQCSATFNVAVPIHSALYFHRQRNIKFSFRRHILYNKINLPVVPKPRPLRTKFQKYSRNGSHGNSLRTTQSLLFISFTKPSMTTLPSSSSKVKPCFLFEWYSRVFGTKRKF
jgi:hypothetical protein